LDFVGESEAMFAAIFLDTYKSVFDRDMKQDYLTSITDKIESRLGREVFANVVKYGLDDGELYQLKQQFTIYQETAVSVNNGLLFLLQKNYNETLDNLFYALQLQSKLKYDKLKIENQIKEALLVSCWDAVNYYLSQSRTTFNSLVCRALQKVCSIARTIVDNNSHKLMTNISEKIFAAGHLSHQDPQGFQNLIIILTSETKQSISISVPSIKIDQSQIDNFLKKKI